MGVTADVTSVKDSERLRAERERLVATTEMSASLAHEINNPLAAVTGSLYMAQQLGIQDEELEHYLAIANVEAKRIADIVKRLLQVHRSSSAPVAFDVVKLWSEVIEGSSDHLQRNGYNVQMNASGPASVVGYVDELKYGFSNLLSNAMESSKRGSTIRVRIRPAYSVRSGIKGVRVVLCDEGAGIPRAKVKEMFKPFATTKSEKGRGLGLWVTRAAVLKQGGDISIRQLPTPMHGTCVRIFLPNRPAA
jgi:signal transduction histidine kinase